eukprot:g16503.t1
MVCALCNVCTSHTIEHGSDDLCRLYLPWFCVQVTLSYGSIDAERWATYPLGSIVPVRHLYI